MKRPIENEMNKRWAEREIEGRTRREKKVRRERDMKWRKRDGMKEKEREEKRKTDMKWRKRERWNERVR